MSMKVIYGIGKLERGPAGPKVVAVGVFDGIHRGHQLLLRSVVREARKKGIVSAVVTFDRHPSRILASEKRIPSLVSLEQKLSLIEQLGIDVCYCISFNRFFSSLAPQVFIRDILLKKINMVSLVVGEDFVFGRHARGDMKLLEQLSRQFRFRLRVLKHLVIQKRIVSSTLIRDLLSRGNLRLAKIFLGRGISFVGDVIRGEGRGKQLGFPTANLKLHHDCLVPSGIYASYAMVRGCLYKSLTYIGTKPTFPGENIQRNIEVFLIGFNQNIYGKKIEVRLLKKIRDDQRFFSEKALICQIKKDLLSAKKVFSKSS